MKIRKSIIRRGLLILILFQGIFIILAQNPADGNENLRKDAVRFFMDCRRCDDNYIREEIPYVNYVRDVKEAEVYLLMTSQEAGNGGREYSFMFEGQHRFKGMNDTLKFSSMSDDTQDQVRSKQVQILKMGLMRYVARTPLYREVDISHTAQLVQDEVVDQWNNWLFELDFSPSFEGEETYKELSLESSFTVLKITENWKLEFDLDYESKRVAYNFEDTSYTAFQDAKEMENLIVKSINEHWSVGGELNLRSSTFSNYKLKAEIIPAIEYNIFPYSEATQRQLRMLYGIGFSSNMYYDTTVYGKTSENLFLQSFKMGYEVRQKWGSINLSMEASNYLHDFSKNRINFGGYISIRIIKGLSLRVHGEVARVRDQVSLAKGELTEADLLLRLQEMATGYYYRGSLGISYTFGSIYNNIVNPRFGHY